jgi:hypothetical protein
MPSEKAKENKILVAQCAGCEKTMSVEVMQSMVLRRGRHAVQVPVCDACRAKGWQPPAPEAA